MPGHSHNPTAATQNQGNSLGDRSCVRQSKLYRMYESGNSVKSLLGTGNLCWKTDQKEGAYKGQRVFDHNATNPQPVNKSSRNSSSKTHDNYDLPAISSKAETKPPIDKEYSSRLSRIAATNFMHDRGHYLSSNDDSNDKYDNQNLKRHKDKQSLRHKYYDDSPQERWRKDDRQYDESESYERDYRRPREYHDNPSKNHSDFDDYNNRDYNDNERLSESHRDRRSKANEYKSDMRLPHVVRGKAPKDNDIFMRDSYAFENNNNSKSSDYQRVQRYGNVY